MSVQKVARKGEGIKLLKTDKVGVENVFSKIRRIFDHYAEQGESQRNQAYESLKADFEVRIQQAVRQQMGTQANFKINVENQPQFKEEWRRTLAQMDSQYISLINEYKQELKTIS